MQEKELERMGKKRMRGQEKSMVRSQPQVIRWGQHISSPYAAVRLERGCLRRSSLRPILDLWVSEQWELLATGGRNGSCWLRVGGNLPFIQWQEAGKNTPTFGLLWYLQSEEAVISRCVPAVARSLVL
jgi:hypothetical protein